MCHRYWPEEGSELYHIYEVHLVSEHIWCDDYLVRSFYLKNLKTGETRTVTQFHFLSWSEGGVPSSTKALLEFRLEIKREFCVYFYSQYEFHYYTPKYRILYNKKITPL